MHSVTFQRELQEVGRQLGALVCEKCGDPASRVQRGRIVGLYCRECREEVIHGRIPLVTSRSPRRRRRRSGPRGG